MAGNGQTGLAPVEEKTWTERLLAPTSPDEMTLMDAPQNVIVDALMEMRNPRGWTFHGQDIDRHGRIVQLVNHLVRGRGQKPDIFMYECLMDAMSDPQGSVSGVQGLLEDMESHNIKPTGAICRAALMALANHPDYATRLEVVQIMHSYWFPLDVGARQSLLIGLLRDEQYEMAYARLTETLEQKARIKSWVLDIFILLFAKIGFLDEMLLLLLQRRRMSEGLDEAMINLLYQALDSCSQAFHHRGTTYAWTALVKNATIQPPDGILDNILSTASRHGDAILATEVLDLISRRAWVLPHHYEAVAEAFAQSGNVMGALRILCIMKKSGISILREHTRSIKTAMKREAMSAEKAEEALRKLATEETLPFPAVSAWIEVTAELYGSEMIMEVYRDLKSLCGEKAEGITVMWLIIYARSDKTRRELARDYQATVPLETEHKGGTGLYKLLIPACAQAGELDLAFRFAKQAIPGSKTGAYLSWVKPLMECAAAQQDERIWEVVKGLGERRDPATASMLQTMLDETQQATQAAGWAMRVSAATAVAKSKMTKATASTSTSDSTLRSEKPCATASDLSLASDPPSST